MVVSNPGEMMNPDLLTIMCSCTVALISFIGPPALPVAPPHSGAEKIPAIEQPIDNGWSHFIKAGENAYIAGDDIAAERNFLTALKLARNNYCAIETLDYLYQMYYAEGDLRKVEKTLRQFVRVLKLENPRDRRIPDAYAQMAAIQTNENNELAELYCWEAIHQYQKLGLTDSVDYGSILGNLAWLEQQRHDYAAAAHHSKNSLEALKKNFGPNHSTVAMMCNQLAEIYVEWGKPQLASVPYQEAIAVLSNKVPQNDPLLQAIKIRYKNALIQARKKVPASTRRATAHGR